MFVCVLCGRTCKGHGNNPEPLADRGECCEECNLRVIEARLSRLFRWMSRTS